VESGIECRNEMNKHFLVQIRLPSLSLLYRLFGMVCEE
jgi:hypothetical protein